MHREDRHMTLEEARRNLKDLELREFAYNHAAGMLYFDGVTAAPKGTYVSRGKTLSVLNEEIYKLSSSEAAHETLKVLAEHMDELTEPERRLVQLREKALRFRSRVPMDEYVAYQELLNEAATVWREAKGRSDFAMFEPLLQKIVEASRRFAALVEPEKDPYDFWLDNYEEGMTQEFCDKFFAKLREKLVPLIARVGAAEQPDTSLLDVRFPLDKQAELSAWLMRFLRLDLDRCGLTTTEHPFTIDFSRHDVRITTKYYENAFASSMFSVIHEGGHALYELGTSEDYAFTQLGRGVSMGVHESQSRFYENIIGRSKAFCSLAWPELVKLCPELGRYDAEQFWRAVNSAKPGLIRIEADELTYSLHIMVRYDLERALLHGELEAKDLPSHWNELYKKYLGVDVPDDARGVLQDSHWSGGQLGYFPSYALGSAYGAQLLAQMRESVDVDAAVASGDISPVNTWLCERIWKYGSLKKPSELMRGALGGEFDPSYYTDYLEAKLCEVYRL